jgi:putative exporter of polyketide antibiotics
MQKENQSLTFDKKTQNMRKMHKNRQNSVVFISNICFHVGMDAREMKKKILVYVLQDLQTEALGSEGGAFYQLGTYILDKEVTDITNAEYNRFLRVLDEMLENAESKI